MADHKLKPGLALEYCHMFVDDLHHVVEELNSLSRLVPYACILGLLGPPGPRGSLSDKLCGVSGEFLSYSAQQMKHETELGAALRSGECLAQCIMLPNHCC